MGWRKKVKKARHLHRPSLKNWERDGLYYKFPSFAEEIINKREKYESFVLDQRSLIQLSHETNNITEMIYVPKVIDSETTSPQQFIEKYEAKKIPTVIKGIPYGHGDGSQKEWPAVKEWTLEKLESDPSINSRLFKVGEDDDGKSLKLKMKHFLKYLHENKDDSPLYIFDSAFDEDKKSQEITR